MGQSYDNLLADTVRAAERLRFSSLDVANLLRFRIRAGAFPDEAADWFGGPMLLREWAAELHLRYDNATLAPTAMALDLVHAPSADLRLSLEDLFAAHESVTSGRDPSPLPRLELESAPRPREPADLAAMFERLHAQPEVAWRALWPHFVGPFERWSNDLNTPAVRRILLKPQVTSDDLARVAWAAGLHLRFNRAFQDLPRLLRGWSSAPRGFLLFDWLGAQPLEPYHADVRLARLEASHDAVDELWSHVLAADIADDHVPFASEPKGEDGWVLELNRLAMVGGNDPELWPDLERHSCHAIGYKSAPRIVQAGLWAARWLPTPHSTALRALYLPLLQDANAVTQSLAKTLASREKQ